MSLDPNIKALMREAVLWERALAMDKYTDQTYAPAVELECFIEPSGFAGGGNTSLRRPDGTVVDPQFDVHFDASDPNVELFSTDDFFTVTGESEETLRTQAARITNFYGPLGDAWTRVVTL